MLGIGVAEHTGFINTGLRAMLSVTAKWLLTPMVIAVGIVSHTAVDAGYVLVIPLGGVIFYAAGRHPLAGIAAAYDGLVELLGGEPTPAIGWALGIERVVGLMQAAGLGGADTAPAVYLVLSGEHAERAGIALGEQLRDALPGAGVLANMEGGSFKSQMKRADRSGAAYAVILGDDEAARGVAAVKSLRTAAAQQEWPWDELAHRLAALLRPAETSGNNDGR
jgi:hypothetical protein